MRMAKRLKVTARQPHAWSLPCSEDYSLRASVTSYGFFMLAPNVLAPASAIDDPCTFQRMLQTGDGQVVGITVTQQGSLCQELGITATASLTAGVQDALTLQIKRMLSLRAEDQEVAEQFHALHHEARAAKFGYMFRSPSLWEDLVKSITLCNCGWGRTIAINAALCDKLGAGAFPTPAQLLSAGASGLQACGLGYRAKTLLRLAEQCSDEHLAELESLAGTASNEELYKALLPLAGMGPFTCTNAMQLLSRFDAIPCDSETLRHLKMCRGKSSITSSNLKQAAAEIYAEWQPFQFLAYWFELCQFYQGVYGPFFALDPAHYHKFSGAQLRKAKLPMPASS